MKATVPETTLVRLMREDCVTRDWSAEDLADAERKARVKRVRSDGTEDVARMLEDG